MPDIPGTMTAQEKDLRARIDVIKDSKGRLSDAQKDTLRELKDAGWSTNALARIYQIDRSTVRYHVEPGRREMFAAYKQTAEQKRREKLRDKRRSRQRKDMRRARGLKQAPTNALRVQHPLWYKAIQVTNGCRRRNAGDIDAKWAYLRYMRGVCELSGVALVHEKWHPMSPEIDRVDVSKGYSKDNCRVICRFLNQARAGGNSDEQLLETVKTIAKAWEAKGS